MAGTEEKSEKCHNTTKGVVTRMPSEIRVAGERVNEGEQKPGQTKRLTGHLGDRNRLWKNADGSGDLLPLRTSDFAHPVRLRNQ